MARGARSRRFRGKLAPEAAELNASVGFDRKLLAEDVAGSIAHARMLGRQGILPADEVDRIVEGLRRVEAAFEADPGLMDPALEDVHMNVEARLVEEIGEAGGRLHTGRSRNDQIATDLKLYARRAAAELAEQVDALRRALVEQAEAHLDDLIPGYTHLQRAQPVRLAHHLMAYEAMLRRDRDRIADAAARAGECPLGSGALAATTFPLDRDAVADELGFEELTRNSLDAVSDRDFAVELVGTCALCQVHLSRLGEEIVLWASQEFGFVRLPEAYASGSSIMPQKMNPDLAELVRAKVGRIAGDWVTLITVLKGLPLAYNKDLQETQEPLFDAVESLSGSLRVCAGLVAGLEFDGERMRRAASGGHLLATEVADYLAARGMPFRQAHDVAGALVRRADEAGVGLADLPLSAYQEESELFEEDLEGWLDPASAVDRRDLTGGPAREQIRAEIERARADLEITGVKEQDQG